MYSSDGGKTWAKNLRVSDRSMNQNEGYVLNPAYDLRGPMAIASTDDAASIAWPDSRAGRVDLPAEDLYFASVIHDAGKFRASGKGAVSVDTSVWKRDCSTSLVYLGLGSFATLAIVGAALLLLSRRTPPRAEA